MFIADKRVPHLLALLMVVLYLAELHFVFSVTPTGYSVNIYDQIGSRIVFINITIYAIYLVLLNKKKNPITGLFAVIIILLNYLTLMVIPVLLGYYVTDRGDTLDSVGLVRYIMKTGHVDSLDIYPMTFVESSILGYASNIELPWIPISFLASLLFILGTVTFARVSLKYIVPKNNTGYIAPALLGISIPYYLGMYHTSFIAQYVTFAIEGIFLLSLFLYLYNGSNKFLILLLIFAIFSVFGHPVLGVFNIYFLLLYSIFLMVKNNVLYNYVRGILKVMIIVLILWFIKAGLVKQYVHTLQIIFRTDFRIYASAIRLSKEARIPMMELLRYMFVRYGDQIILYMLSLLSISLIIRKRFYADVNISPVVTGFVVSNMFVMAVLVFPILKQNYNRVLGLNLGLYFAISLAGLLMMNTLEKNIVQTFIRLMLFTIYIISVMGLFLSPLVGFPFIGITDSEVSGVTFMFTHQTSGYKVVDPVGDSKRYSIWFYGYSETFKQGRVLYLYRLPDHFNYPNVYPIKNNQYLIKIQHNIFMQSEVPYQYNHLIIPIAKYMIEPYEVVSTYRRVHRWSYRDLEILYCDPTANIVYRNGSFNIIVIP